jgi:hypothetical protein
MTLAPGDLITPIRMTGAIKNRSTFSMLCPGGHALIISVVSARWTNDSRVDVILLVGTDLFAHTIDVEHVSSVWAMVQAGRLR